MDVLVCGWRAAPRREKLPARIKVEGGTIWNCASYTFSRAAYGHPAFTDCIRSVLPTKCRPGTFRDCVCRGVISRTSSDHNRDGGANRNYQIELRSSDSAKECQRTCSFLEALNAKPRTAEANE